MGGLVGGAVQVGRLLCSLRGGSQPVLVEGTNGVLYVLKFKNNLQGSQVLFNEAAGAELFRAVGLTVPPWEPLSVSDGFLDRNDRCWLRARGKLIRPESGLSFGSRFQGSLRRRLLIALPGSYHPLVRNRENFWLAWMIDVCCDHDDKRQAVFLEGRDRTLEALFVDSGHMFGGPGGERQPPPLASCYFDRRIYPKMGSSETKSLLRKLSALDADRLWKRVCALPDEWKSTSGIERFSRSLDRLTSRNVIQSTSETLFELHRRIQSPEHIHRRWNDQRSVSVLSNIIRVERSETRPLSARC